MHRGDPHYVGLMGIDIFDRGGHLVQLTHVDNQIWADPADINVLPEYGASSRRLPAFMSAALVEC